MPVIIFFSCFVNLASQVDFGGRPTPAVFSSESPTSGPPLPFRRGPSLQQIIKRLAQGFIDLGHWRALSPLSLVRVAVWLCFLSRSPSGAPHLRQNRSTGQSRKEFFCSFGLEKHLSSICFGSRKRKIKCFFSFLETRKRLSSCNITRFQRNRRWGTSEGLGEIGDSLSGDKTSWPLAFVVCPM
jgi:hypothetical protein